MYTMIPSGPSCAMLSEAKSRLWFKHAILILELIDVVHNSIWKDKV